MKPQTVVILFTVGLDAFSIWGHHYYNYPYYTPIAVTMALIAMAAINFLFGWVWCGLQLSEKAQLSREKTRDMVTDILLSKQRDKVDKAMDVLNHPSKYPNIPQI